MSFQSCRLSAAGINHRSSQLCPHPSILTHCIQLDLFLLLAASTQNPGAFWYVGTFSLTRHLAPLVTHWRRGWEGRGKRVGGDWGGGLGLRDEVQERHKKRGRWKQGKEKEWKKTNLKFKFKDKLVPLVRRWLLFRTYFRFKSQKCWN